MSSFMYIECDVPEGIELIDWGRTVRIRRRRRRLHLPRLRIVR